MMKNKKVYILLGMGFLLLLLAYFFIYSNYYEKEKKGIMQKYDTLSVTVIIDYGNGITSTVKKNLINANRTEPYTAFEVLNNISNVDAVKYSWGTSIRCINDVCSNESIGYYWFFWINGNFSSVTTEKLYLRDGDIITMNYTYGGNVGM